MKKFIVIGIILLTAGPSWAQSDPTVTAAQAATQDGTSETTRQRPRNPFAAAIASAKARKTASPQTDPSAAPVSSTTADKLAKQPFRVPRPAKAQQQAQQRMSNRRPPSRPSLLSKNQNQLIGNPRPSSGQAFSSGASPANQNQLIRNPAFQPANAAPQTPSNPGERTSSSSLKQTSRIAQNTFQMETSRVTAAKDASQQKTL